MDDFSPIYHVNKSIRQTTLVDLIKKGFQEYGTLIEEKSAKQPCGEISTA